MKPGNNVVWDLSHGVFYEVYYFTTYHEPSGKAFWIRSTLLKSSAGGSAKRGALWCAVFDSNDPASGFGVHKYFDAKDVSFSPGSLSLKIGESEYREGVYHGKFSQEGHDISWDLSYAPHEEDLWLIPSLVKKTGLNKADVCTPNVDISLYGNITIDGEEYIFDGIAGAEAHHWGRHYAPEWIWGHCNEFEDRRGAWLEVLSAKFIQKGPIMVPATMIQLNTGIDRFSIRNPVQLFAARAGYNNGCWRYVAKDNDLRIEAEFKADYDKFLMFPYLSPHDEQYYCYNSCLVDLIVRVYRKGGVRWRQVDELVSKGRAAAEYCSPQMTKPDKFVYQGMTSPLFIRNE